MSLVAGLAIWAWSDPNYAPPSGNIYAPINTGAATQTKNGSLVLGSDSWTQLQLSQSVNDTWNPLTGASDTAHYHFTYPNTPSGKKPLLEMWSDLWVIGGDKNLVVDGSTKSGKFCLGTECCSTWDECVALGGGGGGGCKSDGAACSTGAECCSTNCPSGICAPLGADMLPQSACANTLSSGNRKIFVTAGSYKGSAYQTAAAADSICYNAALNASIPDAEARRFYGLVATADRDPMSLLTASKYWNGAKVGATANCEWKIIGSPSTMFSNTGIQNPIHHDQWGNAVAAGTTVMTSFKPVDGAAIVLSQSTYAGTLCSYPGAAWTKKGPCGGANACTFVSCAFGACMSCCDTYKHWYGNANDTDTKWAYAGVWGAGTSSACNDVPRALYCVEKY